MTDITGVMSVITNFDKVQGIEISKQAFRSRL